MNLIKRYKTLLLSVLGVVLSIVIGVHIWNFFATDVYDKINARVGGAGQASLSDKIRLNEAFNETQDKFECKCFGEGVACYIGYKWKDMLYTCDELDDVRSWSPATSSNIRQIKFGN